MNCYDCRCLVGYPNRNIIPLLLVRLGVKGKSPVIIALDLTRSPFGPLADRLGIGIVTAAN